MYEKMIISENGNIQKVEEATIAIPVSAFVQLVKAEEKIEAVKRIYYSNKYFCSDDVLAILEIKKMEENENA